MAVHRYHPDPTKADPKEAQLWDDCERCDEQAAELYELDQFKLTWFWMAMDGIEHEEKHLSRPITKNEQKVINRMYEMAVVFERMTGIWPSPANLLTLKVNTQPGTKQPS